MDDLNTLERQIEGQLNGFVGPVLPVDDAAIFNDITAANRQKGWGFTMFSALKFVAAGVIVALFGGFLLSGILTAPQDGEGLQGASTASPSPITTEELLSGMATEEVEPGVFRVVNDGVRDLTSAEALHIVTGQDGSVWAVLRGRLRGSGDEAAIVRLGAQGSHRWRSEESDWLADVEVASDGTVWAAIVSEGGISTLRSFDGEAWTTHTVVQPLFSDRWPDVEVTPSGKVWAVQVDGTLGYLEEDGASWRTIAVPWPGPDYFQGPGFIATDSEVWVPNYDVVWHFSGGTWQPIAYSGEDTAMLPEGVFWAVGHQGFAELTLYRHDEQGWKRWSLKQQGMLPGPWTEQQYAAGPDGSFWAGWTVWDGDYESTGRCAGVSRFDGATWTPYLPGMCVGQMAIAADGSAWITARQADESDRQPATAAGLYVITPEAVAA